MNRYKDKIDAIEKAKQIYQTAVANGNKFPLIPVAQAVLESGWFKKESGKNNFFGQKATNKQPGRSVMTKEEIAGTMQSMEQRFRDYESLEDSIKDHLGKWQKIYNEKESLDDALSALAPKYATDSSYADKVKAVMHSLQKRGVGTGDTYLTEEKKSPDVIFSKNEYNQIVNVNPKRATRYEIENSPKVEQELKRTEEAKQAEKTVTFKDALVKGKVLEDIQKISAETTPIGYDLFIPQENEFYQHFQSGGKVTQQQIDAYNKYRGNQGMYLDEGSKAYKDWVERDKYYNPPKEKITSGNPAIDFLYMNDWLFDVPIVKDVLKNVAYNAATQSNASFRNMDYKDVVSYITGKYPNDDVGYFGHEDISEAQNNNIDLVSQYIYDNQNLPKSKYKPTSDYFEFLPSYSLKGDFDKRYINDIDFTKGNFDELLQRIISRNTEWDDEAVEGKIKGFDEAYSNFLKNKKPIYRSSDEEGMSWGQRHLYNVDLAGHKIGAAWDEEKNLPYISISDAWDFEPTHYGQKWGKPNQVYVSDDWLSNKEKKEMYSKTKMQAHLMHKAGQPFKVYDRFYFNPETREYIPDSEVEKRKKK